MADGMTLSQVNSALAGGQPLGSLLRETCTHARAEQEAVLRNILSYGSTCTYGTLWGFDGIDGYEAFCASVPVTDYSDYLGYIEAMKDGAEDVLFPGRARSFVVSTGTTGIPKYIPESDAGALAKSLVSRMRAFEWKRLIPEAELPERKYLPVTNAAVYEVTAGGIPAGSASGLSAVSRKQAKKTRKAIPDALLTIAGLSRDAMDYLTMLFSIAEPEVAKIACNNVAHFHLLWKLAQERATDLVGDIRSGTLSADLEPADRATLMECWAPNPARADELECLLRDDGTLRIERVWPHFQAVVCWIGGSVGRAAREYRTLFPAGTTFINWGYGASEGKFDVPTEAESTEGLLTLFGYFYEFLEPGAKTPVPLWEARDGVPYELVLTSYSGFYRYNIHDLVSLGTNADGMRTIRFLGKTSDSLEVGGQTLYGGEFLHCIEQYERAHGIFFRLVQGTNDGNSLRILAEGTNDDWDTQDFCAWAREQFGQRGVPFAGVTKLAQGYRDSLFEKVMDSGKSVNSTKVAVFVKGV
ncbi:MAG: GH3 auxin-responsive promoter family protein [Atopobiaceae bacterium]|nr:GH3 auxin-responsive promoter family protein [Atopobiaceae bacterium]